MLKVTTLEALNDNYIFVIESSSDSNSDSSSDSSIRSTTQFTTSTNNKVSVVDPSCAETVKSYLKKSHAHLDAIFITHHHYDHTGGVKELVDKYHCKVYGSLKESNKTPQISHPLDKQTEISWNNNRISIFYVPGHTIGHIAYFFPKEEFLFCGDTLFSAGCGRVFEGTTKQMHNSLETLKTLPKKTKIFCAHEYTLNNLKFSSFMDEDNEDIKTYTQTVENLRNNKTPSIPTTIDTELRINPFLRCNNLAFKKKHGFSDKPDWEFFQFLRKTKDSFK